MNPTGINSHYLNVAFIADKVIESKSVEPMKYKI